MAKLKLFTDNVIENHTISMQLNKFSQSAENRLYIFHELAVSAMFKNFISLLDIST